MGFSGAWGGGGLLWVEPEPDALLLPSVPQQSKRLSTPAIALRSKSMTSELEEMGKSWAGPGSGFLVTSPSPPPQKKEPTFINVLPD